MELDGEIEVILIGIVHFLFIYLHCQQFQWTDQMTIRLLIQLIDF